MAVLLLSGLPEDQIYAKDVLVGEHDYKNVYIHTVICGDYNPWRPDRELKYRSENRDPNLSKEKKPPVKKPILVLIHGWGGSGPLFFKILKQICKYFCLILIDVPGMGASSRPLNFDYNKMTVEQSIDYFVDYFEAWRKEMGDLKDFYLSAHSFGGYLAGCWALKYPQHFKKLLLLSPIGV